MGGSRRATSGLWQVPLTHLLLHVQAASWLCGRTSVQGSVVAAVPSKAHPAILLSASCLPSSLPVT